MWIIPRLKLPANQRENGFATLRNGAWPAAARTTPRTVTGKNTLPGHATASMRIVTVSITDAFTIATTVIRFMPRPREVFRSVSVFGESMTCVETYGNGWIRVILTQVLIRFPWPPTCGEALIIAAIPAHRNTCFPAITTVARTARPADSVAAMTARKNNDSPCLYDHPLFFVDDGSRFCPAGLSDSGNKNNLFANIVFNGKRKVF